MSFKYTYQLKTTGEKVYPFLSAYIVSEKTISFEDFNFQKPVKINRGESCVVHIVFDANNKKAENALLKKQLLIVDISVPVILYDPCKVIDTSLFDHNFLSIEEIIKREDLTYTNHYKKFIKKERYNQSIFFTNSSLNIYLSKMLNYEQLQISEDFLILENDLVFRSEKSKNAFMRYVAGANKKWASLYGIDLDLIERNLDLVSHASCLLVAINLTDYRPIQERALDKLQDLGVKLINYVTMEKKYSRLQKYKIALKLNSNFAIINHFVEEDRVDRLILYILGNLNLLRVINLLKEIRYSKSLIGKIVSKCKRLLE